MSKLIGIVIFLAAVFLAACAAPPAPTPTTEPPVRATAAPIEQPTDASAQRPTAEATRTERDPLPPDVLAVYHKSGGFAGLDETTTIYQGGLVEVTGRRLPNGASVKLDEPMLQPVRRMFESQEFADLETSYRALGADLFTYTITARDRNGNMKTVTAMDGSGYPDFLGQLIVMLEQLRDLAK